MNHTLTVHPAIATDYREVCTLLSAHKLPVADIQPDLAHFFTIKHDGNIVAAIGMEIYSEYGLLRSMVTDSFYRNQGHASELINKLFQYAANLGVKEMYLLTETAEKYFKNKGFEKIDRESVPEPVKGSSEFSSVCPVSAAVMKKQIL